MWNNWDDSWDDWLADDYSVVRYLKLEPRYSILLDNGTAYEMSLNVTITHTKPAPDYTVFSPHRL